MRCLAFDPGTKIIGWAVLENLHTKCVALNIVATGKLKGTNSDHKGTSDIRTLVEIYHPDFLAYEKAGSKKLNPVFKRIISNAIATFGIPCIGYTVPDIRDDLYDGAHAKGDTLYFLKERFPMLDDNISGHELDALSVGLYGLNMKTTGNDDGNPSPTDSADPGG